jgi:hypothetical protein
MHYFGHNGKPSKKVWTPNSFLRAKQSSTVAIDLLVWLVARVER